MKKRFRRAQRGSILVASLWALSVFSVMVSGLAFQAGQQGVLVRRETDQFESRLDFMSGLHLLARQILEDPEPGDDSPMDSWFGDVTLEDTGEKAVLAEVSDEESRINLNKAGQNLLEALFEEVRDSGIDLRGDAEDFSKAVIARRENHPLLSIEELHLLEDVTGEDAEALRPYLTVATAEARINLNTADPVVLRALMRSISGDDYAKKEVLEKLFQIREAAGAPGGEARWFVSQELQPEALLTRLEITPTAQVLSIVYQLAAATTTDSRTWHVFFKAASGRRAETVFQYRESDTKFQVLKWREF